MKGLDSIMKNNQKNIVISNLVCMDLSLRAASLESRYIGCSVSMWALLEIMIKKLMSLRTKKVFFP